MIKNNKNPWDSILIFTSNSWKITKVIEVARKRTNQTVTYQTLWEDCSLKLDMRNSPYDRKVIGVILGDISIFEHKNQRQLLSSLVVRSNDDEEGNGLYKLCEELASGKAKKLMEDYFEYAQIRDCIDFWNNEKNIRCTNNMKIFHYFLRL